MPRGGRGRPAGVCLLVRSRARDNERGCCINLQIMSVAIAPKERRSMKFRLMDRQGENKIDLPVAIEHGVSSYSRHEIPQPMAGAIFSDLFSSVCQTKARQIAPSGLNGSISLIKRVPDGPSPSRQDRGRCRLHRSYNITKWWKVRIVGACGSFTKDQLRGGTPSNWGRIVARGVPGCGHTLHLVPLES
jgi:hypothetical protein